MFLRGFPSMTLEASVECERIAAEVREDALLLDLVQSTPIGGLLDVLHREARGCGRGGNRTFFGSGIVTVNLQRCSHRCQFASDETRIGASTASILAGRQLAHFPRFRADFGRTVQQAAESAVSPPMLRGKPAFCGRVVQPQRVRRYENWRRLRPPLQPCEWQ